MSLTTPQNPGLPRPGSPGWDAHVETQLANREAMFWTKIAAMLAFGPPMCFLGPLAVSGVAWVLFFNGRRAISHNVPWLTVFEMTVAVMLPLLFLREWKAKRTFLEQAFLDGELGHSLSSNMRNRASGDEVYLYLEIFLIGPRLIIGALRQWSERRSLRHIDRRQAAFILNALIQAGSGIEIESLHGPGLDRLMVRKIIIYLAFFEWIDLSSDLTRAWVETTALHWLGLDGAPIRLRSR